MNEEYAQQETISDATYLGAAAVLSIIGIVGFLFNACVIFIMLRDSQVNLMIKILINQYFIIIYIYYE